MLLIDIGLTNASIAAAYYIRFQTNLLPPYVEWHPWEAYSSLAVLETLIFPPVFALQKLYRLRLNTSRIDELYRLVTAISIGTVLTMAASTFIAGEFSYSRGILTVAWVLSVVSIWLARSLQYKLHAWLRRRGVGQDRVLIVGTGEIGRMILEKLRGSSDLGYRPIGFIAADGSSSPDADGLPVLGTMEEIEAVVREYQITEVIVADPGLSHKDVLEIADRCERARVNIKVFPDVFQIMTTEAAIGDLDGLPMVTVRDVALRGFNLAVKRAVDLVVSAAILVLFSPLLLLTALLIKLGCPRAPVFYVQERVGLDGEPFLAIKFRTMRPDAEADTGPVWAQPGDPRVTRLGAFLRRLSFDELPQFINVLRGEMSIVGPRPERPYFVEQFSQMVPRYARRHREKAGLTGWAQVNGLRGNVSIEERTAYDLWYVENWTLWLDFKIMLRTILAIFKGNNAY